jgi:hypothetical protein
MPAELIKLHDARLNVFPAIVKKELLSTGKNSRPEEAGRLCDHALWFMAHWFERQLRPASLRYGPGGGLICIPMVPHDYLHRHNVVRSAIIPNNLEKAREKSEIFQTMVFRQA